MSQSASPRYLEHAAVIAWLQDIDCEPAPDDLAHSSRREQKRKRRRLDDCDDNHYVHSKRQILSPPVTERGPLRLLSGSQSRSQLPAQQSTTMANVGKHIDTVGEDAADMATPRPIRQTNWASSPSTSLSKRSASSSVSRNPSPTKQLRLAELDNHGFSRRAFPPDTAELPASLQRILDRMEEIEGGGTKLPRHWWQPEIAKLKIPNSFFDQTDLDNQQNSQQRPPISPDVSFSDFIARTLWRAIECDENNEAECVWSDQVYRQILSWVLRPNNDMSGLVDFQCCTSAKISRAFSSSKLSTKMVDYCLVVKPPVNSDSYRRISSISESRPGVSINHTESGSLCRNPIGVSLEFKSPDGSATQAIAQMGTWHAAQWRSLSYQTGHAPLHPAIEFLPGIIVQGHEWFFVATVPPRSLDISTSDSPTISIPTLYSKVGLGSTSKAKGICKIVASLRCLVAWLEKEYWPGFQAQVLQLPGQLPLHT